MEVVVTPGALSSLRQFDIRRAHLDEAIARPDEREHVTKGAFDMRLFWRATPTARCAGLLVVADVNGGALRVLYAFKVPAPTREPAAGGTPLGRLEALAVEFGCPIRVGSQAGLFILSERVPCGREPAPHLQNVTPLPGDADVTALCVFEKVHAAGAAWWDVGFAFMLRTDRYRRAINGTSPGRGP